jgi:hypothetical protein
MAPVGSCWPAGWAVGQRAVLWPDFGPLSALELQRLLRFVGRLPAGRPLPGLRRSGAILPSVRPRPSLRRRRLREWCRRRPLRPHQLRRLLRGRELRRRGQRRSMRRQRASLSGLHHGADLWSRRLHRRPLLRRLRRRLGYLPAREHLRGVRRRGRGLPSLRRRRNMRRECLPSFARRRDMRPRKLPGVLQREHLPLRGGTVGLRLRARGGSVWHLHGNRGM